MNAGDATSLYSGWSWFMWIGLWFVLISSFGNCRYTYRIHRLATRGEKDSLDFLNERYARGELRREEYLQIKDDITRDASRSGKAIITRQTLSLA